MLKIRAFVAAFMDNHPVIATVIFAAFVCACLLTLFWFVVFSGISSSADFIYNNF